MSAWLRRAAVGAGLSVFFVASGPVLGTGAVSSSEGSGLVRQQPAPGSGPDRNVLLLMPSEPGPDGGKARESARVLSTLGAIIESRYRVELTVHTTGDYTAMDLEAYDALLVIDDGVLHESLVDAIVGGRVPAETAIIGRSAHEALARLGSGAERPAFSDRFAEPRIEYKGRDFRLDGLNRAGFPMVPAGQDFQIVAWQHRSFDEATPLIIDVRERLVLADLPIPHYYPSIDHWSSVLIDVLHRTLGSPAETRPRALVRLEDVNPFTYGQPGRLRDAYRYLKAEQIPFHLAVISRYVNPENDIDIEIADEPNFLELLQRMVGEHGVVLVQHGFDHQIDGVSGIDFEFIHGGNAHETPLETPIGDAISGAQAVMRRSGLPVPDIWETPHYALSPADSVAVSAVYPTRYEEVPGLGLFTFPVKVGGSTFIPENLGYVDSEADLRRIAELADTALVLESPVVSFFWHPWRDLTELKTLIELLRDRGFEFVDAYSLLDGAPQAGEIAIEAFQNAYETPDSLTRIASKALHGWPVAVLLLFAAGAGVHFGKMRSLARNAGQMRRRRIPSIGTLRSLAEHKHTQLPFIAILVPARSESLVIENTIRRLANLDYPTDRYCVAVITDERERHEDLPTTTQEIVQRAAREWNARFGSRWLLAIDVPDRYDGRLSDNTNVPTTSTKGRALNYGLQVIVGDAAWRDIEVIGVFDADARPDPAVLREVAAERLTKGIRRTMILQGPVLQMSNFGEVSLVGKAAGLELALHHFTSLPRRMKKRKVQFLAGTNYFIDKRVLMSCGGWNPDSLVEDADLAVRAYLNEGAKAGMLTSPEIEQTPADLSVYKRQRERWATGQLALVGEIRASRLPTRLKRDLILEIVVAQFRFIYEFGMIALAVMMAFAGVLGGASWPIWLTSVALLGVSVHIWDTYGRVYRALRQSVPLGMRPRIPRLSLSLYFFFPLFMLLQAVPRLMAIGKLLLRRTPDTWYKTERTRETADSAASA